MLYNPSGKVVGFEIIHFINYFLLEKLLNFLKKFVMILKKNKINTHSQYLDFKNIIHLINNVDTYVMIIVINSNSKPYDIVINTSTDNTIYRLEVIV